jgi:hypothetical protein
MGLPIVIATNGYGTPVVLTTNGTGTACTIATNGFGTSVVISTNGFGIPVTGFTIGPDTTAPVITSSNALTIPENQVLTHYLMANEAVTWAKVGGANAADFTLASGVLTLPPQNYEAGTSKVVQVQATDLASNVSAIQTITVTITDVDEIAPTITSAATFSAPENAAYNHTLTANEPVTWAIVGGANAAAFSLVGATLTMAAQDFEAGMTLVVQVRATDTAGNQSTIQTITATITDVAEGGGIGPFTLAWTSLPSELTNLAFTLTPAPLVGDSVTLYLDNDAGVTSPFATSAANVIDSAEAASGALTFTGITTPLSPGLTYAKVNVVRGAQNADSNIVSQTLTGDTTAPVLSSPTGTKTGSTTATLTVSTNEANGTLYGVHSTAAPSKAQIKLGQTSTGAASSYAFNQAVTTTGVQTKNATGLTTATSYTMHFMHEDTAANQSNVASAAAFTTDAGTYIANAVRFDGTNDWLKRGGGLTGAADSQVGILSIWLKMYSTNTDEWYLFSANGSAVLFTRDSGGAARLFFPGGIDLRSAVSSVTIAAGWRHVLMAWNGTVAQCYINDVASTSTATPPSTVIDWTQPDWTFGGDYNTPPTNKVNFDVADFYLNTATFLDMTNVTNRRKFISATAKPVDLGATGATPTGTAPIIYLGNPFGTFQNNRGTGGNFVLSGTLTAAATSPSD